MTNSRSYIVCTSPRSGSTLLCRMLAATHIAGNPQSLFYRPSLDDWARRMSVALTVSAEAELLEAIMHSAIVEGCGDTDVFALRQQRPSFDFLCQKLSVLNPEAQSDLERIEHVFGPTQFIYLTRSNKLEQAVSLLKAEQSGLWHVAADGSEWERKAPPQIPKYDKEAIAHCIELLEAYDEGWRNWFDRERIEPILITYDELSAAPMATLRAVLDFIGLDSQVADKTDPEIKKMADSTNQDWIARYCAETGRS